ncbi:Uncharacterised protein [Mycobacteroides abscessus subsp. abscessus]|nr:Uncharacterised protein [Mycobacteroides abscessus subsp. abscessus]SIM71239.1 Uncharacterised protein [Mycobacteroides abscessus subsp. abscessus]SKL06871.1 Uncharacterised protein [Mycobacteroides abscessus subsp. massiliense]
MGRHAELLRQKCTPGLAIDSAGAAINLVPGHAEGSGYPDHGHGQLNGSSDEAQQWLCIITVQPSFAEFDEGIVEASAGHPRKFQRGGIRGVEAFDELAHCARQFSCRARMWVQQPPFHREGQCRRRAGVVGLRRQNVSHQG